MFCSLTQIRFPRDYIIRQKRGFAGSSDDANCARPGNSILYFVNVRDMGVSMWETSITLYGKDHGGIFRCGSRIEGALQRTSENPVGISRIRLPY